MCSRVAWGVRGYYILLACQLGITTCYYGIQVVYGYLVSPAGGKSHGNTGPFRLTVMFSR